MPLGADSVLNKIIHPRLHASLQRAYPSYVTVQAAIETHAPDNSIIETWADVPHLQGLRGILAVASSKKQESRTVNVSNINITHVLDLQSYHPEITLQHRIAVSREIGESPTFYNIIGVNHDSQAMSSKIDLEIVSF